jgi:hypothetical protein
MPPFGLGRPFRVAGMKRKPRDVARLQGHEETSRGEALDAPTLSQGTNRARRGSRSYRSCALKIRRGLPFCFDSISPNCFLCLVTLGCQVGPGFRFVKGHRLVKTVPLDDGGVLGCWSPLYVYNLPGRGAQGATMGRLYGLTCGRKVGLLGLSIYSFEFADSVGFRLG